MFENNPFSHPTPTPSLTGNLFGGDTASEDALRLDELLTAAEDAIRYGDFEGDDLMEGARTYLAAVTKTIPGTLWRKNARFFMAKMMTDLRISNDDLSARIDDVLAHPDFRRARDYARDNDPTLSARIESIAVAREQEIEQARQAAEEAAHATARREAERRAAEQARLEAERRAAENARLEAERRDAEEARLRAEAEKREADRIARELEAEEKALAAVRAKLEETLAPLRRQFEISPDGMGKYILIKAKDIPPSLVIPGEFISSIADSAFSQCDDLVSVNITEGVTSIGKYAFSYCFSLTSVNLPNSVTNIGSGAFMAAGISSIILPPHITHLSDCILSGSRITSLSVPEGVRTIDSAAFNSCYTLASISLPSTLTFIGNYVFLSCDALTSITVPSGVTQLGDGIFRRCKALTHVTLPSRFRYELARLEMPNGCSVSYN